MRAPHWYEMSVPDLSRSAPEEETGSIERDFIVKFKRGRDANGIETGEDAVSLTDVLAECRRLRQQDEKEYNEKTKMESTTEADNTDNTKGSCADFESTGVKPKGKNPFKKNKK